jgi:hypothetical protein
MQQRAAAEATLRLKHLAAACWASVRWPEAALGRVCPQQALWHHLVVLADGSQAAALAVRQAAL